MAIKKVKKVTKPKNRKSFRRVTAVPDVEVDNRGWSQITHINDDHHLDELINKTITETVSHMTDAQKVEAFQKELDESAKQYGIKEFLITYQTHDQMSYHSSSEETYKKYGMLAMLSRMLDHGLMKQWDNKND